MITGCAGFIGSHLTEKCLAMGWYVYGVDKLSYCSYPKLMDEFKIKYNKQFKFEHKDINDIKHLPDLDILFNICAESHVDNSIENSNEFLKSNINGVHNLLEIIRHKKIRPLFYQMSTDEIYGDAIGIGSHVETDNYNPSNPYSFSKASADLLVKSYARTYDIKYKIGRATNTWGTRQNSEKLIPKTCRNLILGKKISLHNLGLPIRTWLHINDCVDGILTVVEKGKLNEIYNIAGDYEIENWRVVAKIAKILGIKGKHNIERKIDSQIPDSRVNIYGNNCILINYKDENGFFSFQSKDNGLNNNNMEEICDFSYTRSGQDVRYSIDSNKLKSLGWKITCEFDKELPSVIQYYRDNFIW